MRSCSQNTGPILETNLRKLTVLMGIESGSRVESSLYWPRRGLACGDDGILRVEDRNKWGRNGVFGVVEALGEGGTDAMTDGYMRFTE